MFAKENMLFVKNTGIKKIFLISLFFLSWSCLMAKTYYVAPPTATPAGNDSNPGTKDKPWATWNKAFTSAEAGDTVFFRGGIYEKNTYGSLSVKNSGSAGNFIVFSNYPNEEPILDCDGYIPPAQYNEIIYPSGKSYIKFIGLTVRNVHQRPGIFGEIKAFYFYEGTEIYAINCKAYNIEGTAFCSMFNASDGNHYFINCDASYAIDYFSPSGYIGGRGTGFRSDNAWRATGHTYLKGCRAWNCSDQGLSLGNCYSEVVGCWSFSNGWGETGDGHGVKLGWVDFPFYGLRRVVTNCLFAYNSYSGMTTNDADYADVCEMNIYNNTCYKNGDNRFSVAYGFIVLNTIGKDEKELLRTFKNNISYDNKSGPIVIASGALYTHDHNNWDIPLTLTDADFLSLDSTGMSGPRKPDGSLPDLNGFLKLKASSKAIDAGVDVGLPYFGKAPDLGAYEYEPEEIINQYPLISITSPESGDVFTTPVNITITTVASDPDGNIAKVEFFNGSVKIGEKTSAPWSFTWSNVPEGTYNISAVATDNLNAKTPSAAVKITVNQAPRVTNQAPSVSIVKPVAGAVFTAPATITISADATDNDGLISKVEFFHGTTKLGEKSSSPWTFNWNNVPSGSYSLTARATDNSGSKTTSSAVNVTVRAYPVISITSPVSGSSFTAPANITIAANASDPDGKISKVEFLTEQAVLFHLVLHHGPLHGIMSLPEPIH